MLLLVFLCKQKPAYEVRISDWSADVCSADLARRARFLGHTQDQCGGDAASACRFGGEQVLQVTDVGDRCRAAVIEIMDEAEQFALGLGDERMERLVGVEEKIGRAHV